MLQQRPEKEKQEESTRGIERNNLVSKTMNMKLPKLEIKRSSGDPKKYKSFKDPFKVAVQPRSDIKKWRKAHLSEIRCNQRNIQISKKFSRHNRELWRSSASFRYEIQ